MRNIKYPIKFILLLLSIIGWKSIFAQSELDFGKILVDKHFDCKSDLSLFLEKKDSLSGIDKICDSKTYFEIRMFIGYRPTLNWDLFVLTYDKNKWTATKYSYDLSRKNSDKIRQPKAISLKPIQGFDTLFLHLKQANVFSLPDQEKLKFPDSEYLDGGMFYVTFKINGQLRRYSFENPDYYHDKYPKNRYFKGYFKLFKIFTREFN